MYSAVIRTASGEVKIVEADIPLPGSQAYKEKQERKRRQFAEYLREIEGRQLPKPEGFENVSSEDVLSGKAPAGELDSLIQQAKTEKERNFATWAWSLKDELKKLIQSYVMAVGSPPANFREFSDFFGAVNQEGWINPLNGEILPVVESAKPKDGRLQFFHDKELKRFVLGIPTFGLFGKDFLVSEVRY